MENLNSESLVPFGEQISERAHVIVRSALPGGALHDVAVTKVELGDAESLSTSEIYDVIVPPRAAASGPARYQMIEGAAQHAKDAANERADDIKAIAKNVGQIRESGQEDYSRITPNAVMVVQDGANKTSIVRRNVVRKALEALEQPYAVYQLGSKQRVITAKRADGTPNPEHTMLRELAGDFLPEGDFTSFDANLATALADGYTITRIQQGEHEASERALTLTRERDPLSSFMLVEPRVGSFEGGLDAVNELEGGVDGRQIVAATNGQYRPLVELQVENWRLKRDIDLQPSVALGDEPGDATPYRFQHIETAARPAILYANELAILGREAMAYLAPRQNTAEA